MIKKAIRLFLLYFFLALTIVAWSTVDDASKPKVQFEYQQF
ncbi:hypothetical protein SAMN02744775_00373 [Enterobacter sp. CC120223-11]|nr:hypothetical protein SAMN02744775_00373 [Enterobacter sp. CC120223-11]